MTDEEKKTLYQLTAEMMILCAKVKRGRGLLKADSTKLADVLGEMDSYFGITTLRPDVPAKAQKLFYTLQKFYNEA